MKIKPASSIIDSKTNTALEIEATGIDIPRYKQINDSNRPSEIDGKKVSYYQDVNSSDRTFNDQEAKPSTRTAYTKVTSSISERASLSIKEDKVYNGDENEYIDRLKKKKAFVNDGKRSENDKNLEINKTLGLTSEQAISAYVDSKTKYIDESKKEQSLNKEYVEDIKSRITELSDQPNKTIVNPSMEFEKVAMSDNNLSDQIKNIGRNPQGFKLGNNKTFESAKEFTVTSEDVFNAEKRFQRIKSDIDGDGSVSSSYYGSQDDEPTNDLGTNLKNTLAKTTLNLGVSKDTINKTASLFGYQGDVKSNALSVSMTSLQHWKEERIKTLHTNDWKPKNNLNSDANAAGSMMSDLRGELGKTTGGLGGGSNSWTQAGSQLVNSLVGAGTINTIKDIAGDYTKSGVGDSKWQPDVDELAALNTVTKETMYTSKPGIRFKAKSGMVQNITGDQESATIFGKSGYTKDGDSLRTVYGTSLDLLRTSQINATRTSKIRRMVINEDNGFKKKKLSYDLKENVKSGSLYNYTEDTNGFFYWDKSDDLYTNYNLSNEEAQLITLIKNRNTYNKTLGYIYIRPYYQYDIGKKSATNNGLGLFDIPFEFTPNIQESATQANYQQEALLGRLGQFQIFTGTNLPTVSVELQYIALAPDTLTASERQEMNKEWGTDAWQYYWTNNRIEAIEMKLRSLVFADYVSSDYLIKPPLIELHLENTNGRAAETVGDLYKYPMGESADKVGEKYLRYTTSITGGIKNRYKKYIVNSVQIDKISDSDILYPSLYGRVYDSTNKSSNPMWHVQNAVTGDEAAKEGEAYGYSGYARKKGFKATLSLTEVTENYLDLVPDFKAYFDAWTIKEDYADVVSNYVDKTIGKTSMQQSAQRAMQDALSAARNTLLSTEDKIDAMFDEYEKLTKLYAKSYSFNKTTKKPRFLIGLFNEREDGGDVKDNKFNFISTTNSLPPIVAADDGEAAAEKQAKITMTNMLRGLYNKEDFSGTELVKNLYSFYIDVNYSKKKPDGSETQPITYAKFAEDQSLIKFYKAEDLRPNLYRYKEQELVKQDGTVNSLVKNVGFSDFLEVGKYHKLAWMVDKNGKEKEVYGHIDAAIGFAICKDIIANINDFAETIAEVDEDIKSIDAASTSGLLLKSANIGQNKPEEFVKAEVQNIVEALNARQTYIKDLLNEKVSIYGKDLEEIPITLEDNKLKEYANDYKTAGGLDAKAEALYVLANYIKNNKKKLCKLFAKYSSSGTTEETTTVAEETTTSEETNTPSSSEGSSATLKEDDCFIGGKKLFGEEGSVLEILEAKGLKELINNSNRYKMSQEFKADDEDLVAFANKRTEELTKYIERFDTRKSYLRAQRKCLFYNILILCGFFVGNKIKGIQASDISIPKIKTKVYSTENFNKVPDEQEINVVILNDDGKEATPITNPLSFSVMTTNYSVVTLKTIIEAIIEGYNECRELLLNLVKENEDLIGGIPVDNIKAIDLKGKLKQAATTFKKSVSGQGAKLNASEQYEEGTEAESTNEGSSVKPGLNSFFESLGNDMVEGFVAMEKVVFLCESVFNRKSIKTRTEELYIESSDSDKGNVKLENIDGGSDTAKGANYQNYGAGDQREQEAKQMNGEPNNYLPCYKSNTGKYLLKQVEFDSRGDDYWEKEEASKGTHGMIYNEYISQKEARAIGAKLDTAMGVFEYNTYNKLC